MEKPQKNAPELQGNKGTETETEQNNKNTKAERRVQLTLTMLQELANDHELLAHFMKAIELDDESKTPALYAMAKIMKKQTALNLKTN